MPKKVIRARRGREKFLRGVINMAQERGRRVMRWAASQLG